MNKRTQLTTLVAAGLVAIGGLAYAQTSDNTTPATPADPALQQQQLPQQTTTNDPALNSNTTSSDMPEARSDRN